MARIVPTERAYGKIGPNEFRLYQINRGIEADGYAGEITNGHDWPGSMKMCHEGHLVAITHMVRFRLELGQENVATSANLRMSGDLAGAEQFTRFAEKSLEFASVLVKIVQYERRYLGAMSFRTVMDSVFEEVDAFESTLRGIEEARFSSIDPVREYSRKWGESDTAGKEAAVRQAQEEQARIVCEREQAVRAQEVARTARRLPHIASYDGMMGEPSTLSVNRQESERLRRCERCNEAMSQARGIFSRLFNRPYLCSECRRAR